MAKKQTRRSISVSRVTYERLKAYCETNSISMSQFVETRVGDFLGLPERAARVTLQRPMTSAPRVVERPREVQPAQQPQVEPQPQREERSVEPTPPTADQIFTF
jgi:hypothetical protein